MCIACGLTAAVFGAPDVTSHATTLAAPSLFTLAASIASSPVPVLEKVRVTRRRTSELRHTTVDATAPPPRGNCWLPDWSAGIERRRGTASLWYAPRRFLGHRHSEYLKLALRHRLQAVLKRQSTCSLLVLGGGQVENITGLHAYPMSNTVAPSPTACFNARWYAALRLVSCNMSR
jgi:hypothetical protein